MTVRIATSPLVLLCSLAVWPALAQPPATTAGAAAAPLRPPGPPAAPARIDLAAAQHALGAAEAAARAGGVHVAIAVIDANGDLVAFVRMDGASARAVTTSQGKARAALLFGVPSKEVQDAIEADRPLSVRVTAPPAGAWEITPMQGAVPVLRDGRIIAAVGVGGSAPPMDEQIARAGAAALGADSSRR